MSLLAQDNSCPDFLDIKVYSIGYMGQCVPESNGLAGAHELSFSIGHYPWMGRRLSLDLVFGVSSVGDGRKTSCRLRGCEPNYSIGSR